MDPNSGKLQMIQDAEVARLRGLVPVTRDLTVKEKADMQIRLYSPCGCGSRKKLKFCCYRPTTPDQPTVCPACEGAGFTGLGNVCKKCGGSANTLATVAVTVGCPECGGGQWYVSTAVEQCRNCGYSRPNQAEQK